MKLGTALALGLLGTLTALAVICYVPIDNPCPQTVGDCWLIDDMDVRHDPGKAPSGSLTLTSDPLLFDCTYKCPGSNEPHGYYPKIHFTGICPPA